MLNNEKNDKSKQTKKTKKVFFFKNFKSKGIFFDRKYIKIACKDAFVVFSQQMVCELYPKITLYSITMVARANLQRVSNNNAT